jgi:hypothetical protein
MPASVGLIPDLQGRDAFKHWQRCDQALLTFRGETPEPELVTGAQIIGI